MTHILSNQLYAPEQEGHGGLGNTSSSELSDQELEGGILAGQEKEQKAHIEEEPLSLGDNLNDLLEQVAGELQQKEKESTILPFEVDEETGLSLEGKSIEELRVRLQALESRQDTAIADSISESRGVEKQELSTILETAQKDYDELKQQIQAKINTVQAENSNITVSIEEFVSRNDRLQTIFDTLQSSVEIAQKSLQTFDTETQAQIDNAYDIAIKETQEELDRLTADYNDGDAEKHDKKVLLEQKLESLLANPEELFSDSHIAEILAVYGLQEGKERIQQLQEQSKEAQEQQKKNDIKEKILQNIYWSKDNIPELTQAINTDIEAKLKQLQEQNPDLDTITKALALSGKDRFEYLLDSEEPKLEQLAFWSTTYRSGNWETILAEHPQLRQYVENTVNRTFADQEQAKEDFHVQREKQSQERITATIENQVRRYRDQEVRRIQGEISQIQNNETFYTQDRQDKSILQSKEAIRLNDINEIKISIQVGVEGIITSEGRFIIQNDIGEANKQINETMDTMLTEVQGYITGMGYEQGKVRSLDDLDQFSKEIDSNLEIENKKIFKNKQKIGQLTVLRTHIADVKEKYQTLHNQKTENQQIYQQRQEKVKELNSLLERLPQYIKETLMASPMNTMSERLDVLVQELQQYETPAELKATRERIALLQKQIEDLQSVR